MIFLYVKACFPFSIERTSYTTNLLGHWIFLIILTFFSNRSIIKFVWVLIVICSFIALFWRWFVNLTFTVLCVCPTYWELRSTQPSLGQEIVYIMWDVFKILLDSFILLNFSSLNFYNIYSFSIFLRC